MADPLVQKINLVPVQSETVEAADEAIMNNVSETNLVNYTTRVRMDALKLFVAAQLADGIVVNSKLGTGSVSLPKMAVNSVDSDQYVDGSIDAVHLAASAALGNIATNSMDGGKITTNSMDGSKIADYSIIGTKLNANAAVNNIVTNSVHGSKIIDDTITLTKLAANSVDSAQIVAGAIDLAHMSLDSVDSDQYIDGSIDTVHLANLAVTQAKLGAIKRMIMVSVFWFEDLVTVKNFTRIMAWHPDLNGHSVTGAWAALLGAVSSSGAVTMNLINAGGTMAAISIGANAWSAQSGAINGSYDDVSSLASFSVNVTGAGTGAKGLIIYLEVSG